MSDGPERSWWDTATGAVGCAAGGISIVVTAPLTGASCAAFATGVGAAGCGLGAVALGYEIDQTQASCRQMATGQATQSLGNQLLGGGYLGLGYDLAGLAGVIKRGGAKLAGLISQAAAANKLGDLATAARESKTLSQFLNECTDDNIASMLKNKQVTPEELAAAGISPPPGSGGGNVSKSASAAKAAMDQRAQEATRKLAKLDDLNSPEAQALIDEIAVNSTHGNPGGPLQLGKYPNYIEGAGPSDQYLDYYSDFWNEIGKDPQKAWAVNQRVLENTLNSGAPIQLTGLDNMDALMNQYGGPSSYLASTYAREQAWLAQNASRYGYVRVGNEFVPIKPAGPNAVAGAAWGARNSSSSQEE